MPVTTTTPSQIIIKKTIKYNPQLFSHFSLILKDTRVVNLVFVQPAVAALDLPSYQQLSMLPREMFIYHLIKYNAKLSLMHLTQHFDFATATFHLLIMYSTVMYFLKYNAHPVPIANFI